MGISTFKELKEACVNENKTIWELTLEEDSKVSDMKIEDIRENVFHHIYPSNYTLFTN